MPPSPATLRTNRLIEGLPQRDRARLLARCTACELVLSEVLCEPGQPIRHVYFPTMAFYVRQRTDATEPARHSRYPVTSRAARV